MLNKEDMNKYHTNGADVPSQRTEGEFSQAAGATAKTMGGMAWRVVKTALLVLMITGILVFLSVMSVILSYRDTVPPNLSEMSLSYSSQVYVTNDAGQEVEYMSFFANENRVWVPLSDIPAVMQTAQICIEDHRFYEHQGVDWRNTLGAVYGLVGGGSSRGGSTLTQQLIKNVTKENQVSILRKVKEIFTALNLENGYTEDGEFHAGYSKEEILEAYLNVVNYGGQCQGVETAANAYFGKSISECSLAECAVIAGITQNPYQYNPLLFPENAKERGHIVLDRMLELSEEGELTDPRLVNITQDEYNAAIAELDAMTFDDGDTEAVEEANAVAEQDEEKWNWYIDTLFEDIARDLVEKYGYDYDVAVSNIYNAGYEIHCAMDVDLQTDLEELFLKNTDMLPYDPAVELGFFMMDPYTGQVMGVIGQRYERTGIRLHNNTTMSKRQPGSSIKPIGPYALGISTGEITYGSVLKDEPVPGYFGEDSTEEGPQNYSLTYTGTMNVDRAIEQSQNAPAAWLTRDLTPQAVFDWLTNSLHFTTLDAERDANLAPMALGGLTEGATVREMTAAYQIFANGGVYHEPYTYTYVKDHDGNVILDNRPEANPGEQVMSIDDATVMNKLLHRPIYGDWGTATSIMSYLPMEIYGKTGTTDDEYDLWFIGGTPFCVAGIWNGYKTQVRLTDDTTAKDTWAAVMQYLWDNYDWSGKQWVLSENVYQATFCRSSGKLAGGGCYDTAYGWYSPDKNPGTCNGGSDHIAHGAAAGSPAPVASTAPSTAPSAEPSAEPSLEPSLEPTDGPSSGSESSGSESSGSESSGSESSGSESSGSESSSQVEPTEPPVVEPTDPPVVPTDPPVVEPTPPPVTQPTDPPVFEPEVPGGEGSAVTG